ncbi:MAG: hypothetical protein QM783_02170 [Phycisphaerales bacterium]
MRRSLFTVLALPIITLLPAGGCIAWEIRDEMSRANSNLTNANWRLDDASLRMDRANRNIDDANTRMDAVTARLDLATERMAQTHENILTLRQVLLETNQRLTDVQAQIAKTEPMVDATNHRLEDLMVLRQVQQTLVSINTTLGPLSKSMSSVGGVVSLLGLGGESEPQPLATGAEEAAAVDPAAPATTPAPATPKDPASPVKAAPAASQARGPNLLVGAWVLAYPVPEGTATHPSRQALVILATGKYLLAESGRPLVTGDWALKDKTLTLTPSSSTSATAPSSTTAASASAAPPAPQPATMEVLNNTLRTLAVRMGDEVRIYTRP